MNDELKYRLEIVEQKIDRIDKGITMIKRIFLWSFIISIAFIVLPLIGMLFIIPKFMASIDMSAYTDLLGM